MIFQRSAPKVIEEENDQINNQSQQHSQDEVETVVGPSVSVEGDFASEGNIIVKGTVSGSVFTSKHLAVEVGAKIVANIRAGSATIAGEVKGNIKLKGSLELLATAKVLGDIEVKDLRVESGALLYGKVVMLGMDLSEKPIKTKTFKKTEEAAPQFVG
ncbi:MAG TPA: polymer-forming cytoskeletal protein [Candidatus Udaeobacter sp.]|nr:polymer-forming cytoskeletal protein [Candidatus Udaeobacter sp.]